MIGSFVALVRIRVAGSAIESFSVSPTILTNGQDPGLCRSVRTNQYGLAQFDCRPLRPLLEFAPDLLSPGSR